MRKTGIIYVYKHGIVILLMTIGFISLSITGYSAGNGTNKKVEIPGRFNFPQPEDKFTLSGKVSDEKGDPLPGVSIVLVGGTRGVATDLDGSYSIAVTSRDRLLFSFLGMEDQVVTVGNNKVLNIVMKEKGKEVEEVTIVAFAKQKKESVTIISGRRL